MMKKLLLLLILVLTLSGCAPAETAASTEPDAIAEQEPAVPSATPYVSPTPRLTPRPTRTPRPEPFSLIWIADTQNMTREDSAPIHRMTEWIAANWKERNVRYVVHTGDIVGSGLKDSYWERVEPALKKLPKELPFMTVAGNHDVGSKRKYENYIRWRFDTKLPEAQLFQEGRGSYATFETDAGKFLLVGMGITIKEEGYDWLNAVFAKYPDHTGILALHDYLSPSGRTAEGGRVFERVVKPNPNLRFVLCGHNRGIAMREDALDDDGDGKPDRVVYQMMHNFQNDSRRTGYFRILTFSPDRSLQVTTYSPYMDDYNYYESREDEETFRIERAF